MKVTYRLEGVEFEWDARKARTNFEKHGITFEKAAEAFLDPYCAGVDTSPDLERRA